MRLTHLALTNYRNYARLELDLPSGPVLFVGENAQGKTNLLEAVYLLATTRSLRAASDAELIRRPAGVGSPADPGTAGARVVGVAQRGDGRVQVEVVIARREAITGNGSAPRQAAAKRLRVNGIPHRGAGVVGHVLAVLFTSLDIDLVTGPPAGRRRYLDITLSQIDPAYLRALQRYTRVVQQRNSLLRHIDEGRANQDQLATWDEEMVAQGAVIVAARAAAIADEFSFERQAGRRAGEEDKRSFLRKGIVGDWRNYFTREAREVFAGFAGSELVLLGYERDRAWVTDDAFGSPGRRPR